MMRAWGGVRRAGRETALFALVAAVAATGWTAWLAAPVTAAVFWEWNLAGAAVGGLGVGALIVRMRAMSGPLAGVAFGTAWAATSAWRTAPAWTAPIVPGGWRDGLGWSGETLTPGKTAVIALTVASVLAATAATRLFTTLAQRRS